MSAKGKKRLQLTADVDKTLARVDELRDVFAKLWAELQDCSQASRERIELNLRASLEKLKKIRNQIRQWQEQSELAWYTVKFTNYRKLIEADMQRYLLNERESKTKQYSNAALAEDDERVGPKAAMRVWLKYCITIMQATLDRYTETLDELNSGASRAKNSKINSLEKQIRNINAHVECIDQILSAFEDEYITYQDIDSTIRNDVTDLLKCCEANGDTEEFTTAIYDEIMEYISQANISGLDDSNEDDGSTDDDAKRRSESTDKRCTPGATEEGPGAALSEKSSAAADEYTKDPALELSASHGMARSAPQNRSEQPGSGKGSQDLTSRSAPNTSTKAVPNKVPSEQQPHSTAPSSVQASAAVPMTTPQPKLSQKLLISTKFGSRDHSAGAGAGAGVPSRQQAPASHPEAMPAEPPQCEKRQSSGAALAMERGGAGQQPSADPDSARPQLPQVSVIRRYAYAPAADDRSELSALETSKGTFIPRHEYPQNDCSFFVPNFSYTAASLTTCPLSEHLRFFSTTLRAGMPDTAPRGAPDKQPAAQPTVSASRNLSAALLSKIPFITFSTPQLSARSTALLPSATAALKQNSGLRHTFSSVPQGGISAEAGAASTSMSNRSIVNALSRNAHAVGAAPGTAPAAAAVDSTVVIDGKLCTENRSIMTLPVELMLSYKFLTTYSGANREDVRRQAPRGEEFLLEGGSASQRERLRQANAIASSCVYTNPSITADAEPPFPGYFSEPRHVGIGVTPEARRLSEVLWYQKYPDIALWTFHKEGDTRIKNLCAQALSRLGYKYHTTLNKWFYDIGCSSCPAERECTCGEKKFAFFDPCTNAFKQVLQCDVGFDLSNLMSGLS